MYNWETAGRTMVFFFNFYTVKQRALLKLNTSQPPTIRTLGPGITSSKASDQKLY